MLGTARRARGAALGAALVLVAFGAAQAADNDAALLSLGKTLFTTGAVPPCALCHTLKDAGTTGAVGPDLDDLRPDADRVVAALKNGIGAMPAYAASLNDAQMRALARYVSKASGAAR